MVVKIKRIVWVKNNGFEIRERELVSRIKRLGQENDIEYTYFTSNLGIYNMINENITKKQTLKELIVDKIEKGEKLEKII
ncbi:hypothetical protein [Streptococcus phage 94]|nr:hypothetical protein [Streptococcus phage 94]